MKYVSLMLAVAVLAAGCGSSGSDTGGNGEAAATSTSVAVDSELSDAEVVWCDDHENYATIGLAAIRLELDDYGQLEIERLEIRDQVGNVIEGAADTLFGGFVILEWKPTHEAAFVRACKAAFEAR